MQVHLSASPDICLPMFSKKLREKNTNTSYIIAREKKIIDSDKSILTLFNAKQEIAFYIQKRESEIIYKIKIVIELVKARSSTRLRKKNDI